MAVLLAMLVLGHEGRRVAQMLVLAVPPFVWLLWPVRRRWVRRLRLGVLGLWSAAFIADATVRAYLWQAYEAAPDGAMVLVAAANTTARESREFLTMYWQPIAAWSLGGTAAWLLLIAVVRHGAQGMPRHALAPGGASRLPVWLRFAIALLLSLALVSYVSKPWRRLHPVLFWTQWESKVQEVRAGWDDHQRARDLALERARSARPVTAVAGPSTVVLVITDSVNRDNMSLYGYGRATTPQLQARKAALGDGLVVMRNAWSVDASTVPALNNIFHFGRPKAMGATDATAGTDVAAAPHAIALARAAGYKVWWISNHDDLAIEQSHARLADVTELINRTPGRSSASLDHEVVDCVQEAIEDTSSDRKLIVVHLMGAHPHYSSRFPKDANPFDDAPDGVEAAMLASGRSAWVRRFRTQYDAAMLYHDSVVAQLLDITRQGGAPNGRRAWMYLSDHGQEVGHGSDNAGHSAVSESGYRIPTVLWRQPQALLPSGRDQAPFRSDWSAFTLMGLLGIDWTGADPSRDALHPRYQWQAPVLPAPVASFAR
ncbi:sulfatase [Rhodoferax koreense]|uniref:Sulfatase n=2 Tax=Rhodoferax koreensis TaxID=1842727 RepID=A0A1P8K3C5_9BURK|nr:sulfatase [Rhodoferax koreense]